MLQRRALADSGNVMGSDVEKIVAKKRKPKKKVLDGVFHVPVPVPKSRTRETTSAGEDFLLI